MRVFLRGLFLYNKGMTAEEKKSAAFFVDLASDWARGGYFQGEREYCFTDDNDNGSEDSPKSFTSPLVMVIGEVSDSGEDAGLLDKMLGSINLSRESNCIIANNIESEDRLRVLKPSFILCLGESCSQALLNSREPIWKLRGRLMNYKTGDMTIPLIATYHPNDLLRNGDLKRQAWDDLKLLRAEISRVESGAE